MSAMILTENNINLYGSVIYTLINRTKPNEKYEAIFSIYNIGGDLYALSNFNYDDQITDSNAVLRAAAIVLNSYDLEVNGVMKTNINAETTVILDENGNFVSVWTATISASAGMVCQLFPQSIISMVPDIQYINNIEVHSINVNLFNIGSDINDAYENLYNRIDEIVDSYNPDGYAFKGAIEDYRDKINLYYNQDKYSSVENVPVKKEKISPKNDFKLVGMDGEEIKPEKIEEKNNE